MKTDMDAAIAADETQIEGKAMKARLESEGDDGASASGPIRAVRLAMPDGSIQPAAIDADTGRTRASGADAEHD